MYLNTDVYALFVKNCFNFIPLINDLVIKFSAVLSANGSSSRKNLLRKQCGLEPRLFKYYENRFGSVMEVANNIIDNFDKVKEFVTKLSVNKKKIIIIMMMMMMMMMIILKIIQD